MKVRNNLTKGFWKLLLKRYLQHIDDVEKKRYKSLYGLCFIAYKLYTEDKINASLLERFEEQIENDFKDQKVFYTRYGETDEWFYVWELTDVASRVEYLNSKINK